MPARITLHNRERNPAWANQDPVVLKTCKDKKVARPKGPRQNPRRQYFANVVPHAHGGGRLENKENTA